MLQINEIPDILVKWEIKNIYILGHLESLVQSPYNLSSSPSLIFRTQQMCLILIQLSYIMFPNINQKRGVIPSHNRYSDLTFHDDFRNVFLCLAEFTRKMEEVNAINSQMSKYIFEMLNKDDESKRSHKPLKFSSLKQINQSKEQITKKQIQFSLNERDASNKHMHPQNRSLLDDRIEMRYKYVNTPIPDIVDDYLVWFGGMCKEVFSVAFNLYKKGQFDQTTARTFCSENIIRNLQRFSRKHVLSQKDFKQLNESLQKQILPYFLLKYPQSNEIQVNSRISKDLVERDILNQAEYDYIKKSGVKFQYKANGSYNSQIMKVLNYLIEIQNKTVTKGQGFQSPPTLSKLFFQEMTALFRMVEDEEKTKKMLKFDPKNPLVYFLTKFSLNSEQKTEKEREQYAQKVRSYTSFSVGQKVSSNFPSYNESEIGYGDLRLRQSKLMRIVTKWCEELEAYYNEGNILNRELPFTMKNGDQKFFSMVQLTVLNSLLQREKKKIEQKLIEIYQNNYQYQSTILTETPNKSLNKLCQQETIIGHFSSLIFKNNESYLVSYINLLIHGLCSAARDFQVFKYYQKNEGRFHITAEDPHYFLKHGLPHILQRIDSYRGWYNSRYQQFAPQLVSFRIGDLLRCKFASKQSEAVALYRQIQRRSRQTPSQIKILRLKNRLSKGNNDILINFLFRDLLIVELQLSIKGEKLSTAEHLSKFNHYLYELKRSKFGPIAQMCNVWVGQDLRSSFYLRQLQRSNLRSRIKNPEDKAKLKRKLSSSECIKKSHFIRMPFKCSYCKFYYFIINSEQRHVNCESCKEYICSLCQFEAEDHEGRFKLIPSLAKLQTEQLNIWIQNSLPDDGILINLKSETKEPVPFSCILDNNQYYIFHRGQQISLQLIDRVKKNQISTYLANNIILTSSKAPLEKKTKQKSDFSEYFTEKYLIDSYKNQGISVSLANKGLKESMLNANNIQCWPQVKKLNLSENKELKTLDSSVIKFPNVEWALFDNTSLENLPQKMWRSLLHLSINRNTLSNVDSIMQCKHLVSLSLSQNQLESLPQSIGELEAMQMLNISSNKLKKLPPSFCLLKNLWNLDMSNNIQLVSLPKQFGSLEKLSDLNLACSSNLQQFPPTFIDLQKLKYFKLTTDKIQKLPLMFNALKSLDYFQIQACEQLKPFTIRVGELPPLKELKIQHCLIEYLPDSLESLKQLEKLTISKGIKIKNWPQSFCLLPKLHSLNLQYLNRLSALPIYFSTLSSLKELSLYQLGGIQQLPKDFGKFQSLTVLKLLYCSKLKSLPQNLGQLSKLEKLDIISASIKYLPQNFGELQSLEYCKIEWCPIMEFPSSFWNLKRLKSLIIAGFQIKELPNDMGRLIKLNQLKIMSCPKLQIISPDLRQLKDLEVFLLKKCGIRETPAFCSHLSNLRSLKIQQCPIRNLSEDFSKIKVNELYLNFNLEEFPPPSFWVNKNVNNLWIRYTDKIKIDDAVKRSINKELNLTFLYHEQQKTQLQIFIQSLIQHGIKVSSDQIYIQ